MSSNIFSFNCPSGSTVEDINIENKNPDYCSLDEVEKFRNKCIGKENCEFSTKNLACDNYNFDVKYECHKELEKVMSGQFSMVYHNINTKAETSSETKIEEDVMIDGETEHAKVEDTSEKKNESEEQSQTESESESNVVDESDTDIKEDIKEKVSEIVENEDLFNKVLDLIRLIINYIDKLYVKHELNILIGILLFLIVLLIMTYFSN